MSKLTKWFQVTDYQSNDSFKKKKSNKNMFYNTYCCFLVLNVICNFDKKLSQQ